MKYGFSFNLGLGVSYGFLFDTTTRIYELFFWGFNLNQIIKYTPKYVDMNNDERELFIAKLFDTSEVRESLKNSIQLVDIIAEVITGDLSLASDIIVPVDKVARSFIEAIVQSRTNSMLVGYDAEFSREVHTRTAKYMDYIMQRTSYVNRLWKCVTATTGGKLFSSNKAVGYDIKYDQSKVNKNRYTEAISKIQAYSIHGGVVPFGQNIHRQQVDSTEHRQVYEMTSNQDKVVVPVAELSVITNEEAVPDVLVDTKQGKTVSPVVDILHLLSPIVEMLSQEVMLPSRNGGVELRRPQDIDKVWNSHTGIGDIITEVTTTLMSSSGDMGMLDSCKNGNTSQVDMEGIEIASSNNGTAGVEYRGILDVFKHYIRNTDSISVETFQSFLKGIDNTTLLTDKNIDHKVVDVLITHIEKLQGKMLSASVSVYSRDINLADTVGEFAYNKPKDLLPQIDTRKLRPRLLRIGKRWRFRTGQAHDKIWINPRDTVVTEELVKRKAVLDEFRRAIQSVFLDTIKEVL